MSFLDMLKGGLVIFDDFEVDQWINFEEQFRVAMPEPFETNPVWLLGFRNQSVRLKP